MKLHERRDRIEATQTDLSGWNILGANLSGPSIRKANLAGAAISEARLDGMTIDGILVLDLLAAYRAAQTNKVSG